MDSHMTTECMINQLLEEGCRTLEPETVRRALGMGAKAYAVDDDHCPMPFLVLQSKHFKKDIQTRYARQADICQQLFDAGASVAPGQKKSFEEDPEEGIEHILDQFTVVPHNFALELVLLETWLKAGSNPDPTCVISGQAAGLVEKLASLQNGFLGLLGENAQDRFQNHVRKQNRLHLAMLAKYGCALGYPRLKQAGFKEEDVQLILSEVDRQTLERQTDYALRPHHHQARL